MHISNKKAPHMANHLFCLAGPSAYAFLVYFSCAKCVICQKSKIFLEINNVQRTCHYLITNMTTQFHRYAAIAIFLGPSSFIPCKTI